MEGRTERGDQKIRVQDIREGGVIAKDGFIQVSNYIYTAAQSYSSIITQVDYLNVPKNIQYTVMYIHCTILLKLTYHKNVCSEDLN